MAVAAKYAGHALSKITLSKYDEAVSYRIVITMAGRVSLTDAVTYRGLSSWYLIPLQ